MVLSFAFDCKTEYVHRIPDQNPSWLTQNRSRKRMCTTEFWVDVSVSSNGLLLIHPEFLSTSMAFVVLRDFIKNHSVNSTNTRETKIGIFFTTKTKSMNRFLLDHQNNACNFPSRSFVRHSFYFLVSKPQSCRTTWKKCSISIVDYSLTQHNTLSNGFAREKKMVVSKDKMSSNGCNIKNALRKCQL